VIHTVGPVWSGGERNESELLSACYRQSLLLAAKKQLKRIAFPNISTGVYGFPKAQAASIAVETVRTFLEQPGSIEEVIFVVFDEENEALYNALLRIPI
jgi:O-acetyl-ADP-ribose deacetylase (regulator of RNase III)